MPTIREALKEASSFLLASGVIEAESVQHAEWLLMYVLDCTRTQLLMRWNDPLIESVYDRFKYFLERRATGEPVQYIIQEQEFCGRSFYVTSDVLIPRPETELLVEHALRAMMHCGLASDATIGDIGTGSGAIVVSLAIECPKSKLYGLDLSEPALTIAAKNARRHEVADRIEFLCGSYSEPLMERGLCLDVVVSNPPYIPRTDEPSLQREVRCFEPEMALYGGGDDGMDSYREIIQQFSAWQRRPYVVAFEVGIGQANGVAELMRELQTWEHIEIIEDWQNIGRIVLAYAYKK